MEKIIEEFYSLLSSENENALRKLHIPRSDVFYIRAAIESKTGTRYSLDRIERAMYLEGHLEARDVLDPDRKRDWELEEDHSHSET